MILGRSMILASAEPISGSSAVFYPDSRLWIGDWAQELTFYIYISAVTGAPTTGSLTAKVQSTVPHTSGNQYLTEFLFDFDATQKVNLTAEAEDWPSPLCTQATSFPVAFQRTYIGFGKDLRLVLTPAFTGGTSPAFTVTVVAHAKG